jgi:alpha,alpha-trehalase
MRPRHKNRVVFDPTRLDAILFDMDGVVTRTATLHAAAWKQTFDDFLRTRSAFLGPLEPFNPESDYRLYVDGKPRYDGVISFLGSRGLSLAFGKPEDAPGEETVCGLGNRKDVLFKSVLDREGVEVFESTVDLLRSLRAAGLKTGIFSASRHAKEILAAAHVLSLVDGTLDGIDAEELRLRGKPQPDTLLELARRLGSGPARTAIVEDAIAGVQAGRAGRFGLVLGVNRASHPGILLENGADFEVTDLNNVVLEIN